MTMENFADLLEESFAQNGMLEGSVITGTVLRVDGDAVLVDVGLKSEGRVPLKEFGQGADAPTIVIGDTVDVFVERYEDRD
ncbi:MAG: S1 RNA-binding domain-containing protein, partial [Magnetovibrio sp.]|nr:S1 RNA-binding domain-containing protein [Magnetovibrio sp.]